MKLIKQFITIAIIAIIIVADVSAKSNVQLKKSPKKTRENEKRPGLLLSSACVVGVGLVFAWLKGGSGPEKTFCQLSDMENLEKAWSKIIDFGKIWPYEDNTYKALITTQEDQIEFDHLDEIVVGDVKAIFSYLPIIEAYMISFRGTALGITTPVNSLKNIIRDIRTNKKEYTFKDSSKEGDAANVKLNIHAGFGDGYELLKTQVRAKVKAFLNNDKDNFKNKHVIFTGHSLGGALTTVAAADIAHQLTYWGKNKEIKEIPQETHLITFGSPRVGDGTFANFINTLPKLTNNIRVVYGDDIVTHIPLGVGMGFHHVGTEAQYNPTNSKFTVKQKNTDVNLSSDTKEAISRLIDVAKVAVVGFDFTKPEGIKSIIEGGLALYDLVSSTKDHMSYQKMDPKIFYSMIAEFHPTSLTRKALLRYLRRLNEKKK